MKTSILTVSAIVIASVTAGNAQTLAGTPQVVIAVNTGYQATSNDFRDGAVFRDYSEDGRFDTEYRVASGPTFDLSGSRQVWRWLAVGGGISRFSHSTPATLTGSVPHPFFFNRPRSIGGSIAGLTRQELSVHAQLRTIVPVGNDLQLAFFGGPSWFRVRQEIVTDIAYADEYPYDEALLRSNTTIGETGSALGLNAGIDMALFFVRRAGIGMSVQYSSATIDLRSADGGVTAVRAGGIQTGAGLRLRF
jgi:hypothetical protein